MTTCTLCDLPTPDPPVTAEDVDGAFCCRGCLEVQRALGDAAADADEATVRETLGATDEAVPADAERAFLSVDGMHCATCEAFLEGRAAREPGVYDVEASYATDMVRIAYDPASMAETDLPAVVSGFGYTAGEATTDPAETGGDPAVARLLIGGIFGMMTMMWYVVFLYPTYFGYESLVDLGGLDGLYLLGNVWLTSSIVLGYTGFPLLRGAYVSLRAGRPNMDLLVSLAAVSAYAYSSVATVLGQTHVYFDVTVAVVLVVSFGNYYEGKIKRSAASKLSDLTAARITEATRYDDGDTEPVATADLVAGDTVLVRPGERVPTDGVVVEGTAAVDEALVTGESMPRTRRPGDEVLGGTVVTNEHLVVEVAEGATSTLDRLVELLWDIQSSRSGVQRLADKLATVFVPLVLTLATAATVWLLVSGATFTDALLTGLTVLIVSCPCALGLATPLAVAAGIRDASASGAIVTSDAVFEAVPDVDVVVFDKTGTLTDGETRVREVVVTDDADEATLLARAARVERFSAHPLAAAVVDAHDARIADRGASGGGDAGVEAGMSADGGVAASGDAGAGTDADVTDVESHDRGVSGVVDGDTVVVGHPSLLREFDLTLPAAVESAVDGARAAGDVPVVVGWGGRARGVVVVGDDPRDAWDEVVTDLSEGREIVVLTGDDERATERFRAHPGVDEVFAGVPPEAKAQTVRRLQSRGTVAMVGDGSNDAPALAAADIGIALGSGTDLAGDAADAVVVDDDLRTVRDVFAVAAGTHRRIRQNLGWAFLYNAVAIPLALVGLLNPLFAAVAMGSSSLVVVLNSSRRLR